jgi:hypothetical protein
MEVKWGRADDNEEHLPKPVDLRVEAKMAFPRPEHRLNDIPGGGAKREGSNMTKFEIGMSEIESISKRLEIAKNPSRTASCADRVTSTIRGHHKEKRDRNIQEIIHICMGREITPAIPWDSLPVHHLLGMKVKISIRIETIIQHEQSRTPRPSYSSIRR